VDVLLGNGDGTFNGPVSVNAGPIETFAVAVGDVRSGRASRSGADQQLSD